MSVSIIHKPIVKFAFLFGFLSIAFFVDAQRIEERDFSSHFKERGVEGCFLLLDASTNHLLRYNEVLSETGYLPASTFKILNAMIALEEGVIKDTSQIIPWNGFKWPHEAWNRDQTLPTALASSCIWVFFYIAEEVGIQKYQEYINQVGYGNKNITGPSDRFWLAGEFRISARQQIEFLQNFYTLDLPFQPGNIELVKQLLTVEETDDYKLIAKTGAGIISEDMQVMWYVGYLERKGLAPCYFAMNYTTPKDVAPKNARQEITKAILRELHLME